MSLSQVDQVDQVDGRCCFGNLGARQIGKILVEMGLYESPWVHIERIRSHGCYKGSDIPNRDLVCYIRLNLGLDVGWGDVFLGKTKNMHELEVEAGGQNS